MRGSRRETARVSRVSVGRMRNREAHEREGDGARLVGRDPSVLAGSRRVFLETHGCQMNAHDSEKALSLLRQIGYAETENPAEADLVLLNTCSVREKASEKVFHRVEALRGSG